MSRTDLNRHRPRRAAVVLVSTVLAVAVGACAGNRDRSSRASTTTTARTTSFVTAGERLGVGGCPLFPRDHAFHASVAALPVRRDSAEVVAALGGRSLAVRPAFSASIGRRKKLQREARGVRAGHTGLQYTPVVSTPTKNTPSKRGSRAVSAR